MIKCNLAQILEERKLKVSVISRETGINKNTLHRLYNDTATRVDIDVIDLICDHLEIEVGDLYTHTR